MKMLTTEWKKIFHNTWTMIIISALLIIPILYAGVFLKAMWDPYGKTDKLPVAVVNEDQTATYKGKNLKIGQELVDKLKKNDALDWKFTTKTKAMKGLDDGKFYMVIEIPKNFSQDASTVLDKNPHKMKLNYYTNPGQNYIAGKVTDSAAKDINREIAENVTQEYAQSVFDQLKDIGDGMEKASDGAGDLDHGAKKLTKGSQSLSDNLKTLVSSTLTFENGAKSASNGAKQLSVGVSQLFTGSQALDRGASDLNKGIQQYTAGVGQLNNGSMALHSGLLDAQAGSNQLNTGLNQLNSQASGLTDPVSGIPKLAQGQSDLNEGIKRLNTGSQQLEAGLKKLSSSLPSQDNMNQLSNGLSQIKDGLNSLNQNVSSTNGRLSGSMKSIQADMTGIAGALQELATHSNDTATKTVNDVKNTEAFKHLTPDGQKEILGAVQNGLKEGTSEQAVLIKTMSDHLTDLSSQLKQLQTASESLTQLPDAVKALNDGANLAIPKANQALNGYTPIQSVLNQQIIPGAESLTSGLAGAETGSLQLVNGVNQLNEKAPLLVNGVNQLATGSNQLNQGLGQLVNGSNQLVSGSKELDSKSGQLTSGSSQLANGLGHLVGKLPTMKNGASELAIGVNKLADGSSQLHQGSTQLSDGSNKITNGLGDLQNGAKDLSSQLGDGANEINDTNTDQDTYKMFANPTQLKNLELSKVENYGQGLAPYMMSVALFVGALVFGVMFPISEPSMKPTSGFAWWLSKFSVLTFASLVQSMILVAIMVWGVGLDPLSIPKLFLLAFIISLSFMSLIMFFSITCGNVGRFIAMILLVLQLGGSAGTFPIQLSNGFFQAIYPYLPMTYSINGYREVISLGGSMWPATFVLLGIFVVFHLLTVVYLTFKTTKNVSKSVKQEEAL
ncbi:YhgE/Pip domain-containing protein [Terrilactibacillus laevilacticus]|uniref:YhgE/Pip family protein n=1 Tax=Terrilactibacillus laevilacticus TaxID=1380157 RepID=A0ABW5PTS0_9BACI|nr:YhgE/Pip domain-containing protein [Terrilactibacillus laevilacticus]